MVRDRITDGTRIAQLLASELDGRADGPLSRLAVVDADPDVEPTEDGACAYGVELDGEAFAEAFVQPDRVRIDLRAGRDAAVDAAEREGLRVRPVATRRPRALLFVESGAEVKRAVDVLKAAASAADGKSGG